MRVTGDVGLGVGTVTTTVLGVVVSAFFLFMPDFACRQNDSRNVS